MQIKEFADFVGVSVRTLHYYDEIGLLKPAYVDEQTGYRYYDEESFVRMQEILFYRELDFSLKKIIEILNSPDYEKEKALDQQKNLLLLKKERLERMISVLENIRKGEKMSNTFDNHEYENIRGKYEQEARDKWGGTDAYKEYEQKTAGYSKSNWDQVIEGMEAIFARFALCMKQEMKTDADEVQELVKELQDFITGNYYHCTNEILAGLGQMYVADERFKNNIDKHASGTAKFVSEAIKEFCN